MQQSDLEQQPFAVLHGGVTRRLEEDGCPPAFLINVPIARTLAAVRRQLELNCSVSGLYEAIPPPRPLAWHRPTAPPVRAVRRGPFRAGPTLPLRPARCRVRLCGAPAHAQPCCEVIIVLQT
ncbi:hypothetical protein OG252_50230 [Streptomyces sp. NBC_01352]|uniref:hypothetical protein n=1 Tax=Streptomyces sp. NBC_01352 TaxID=2903834 RepID=UPI002E30CBBC|nr:hypothetical protein [Streptomyces sp. NBC_01352]